MRKLATRRQILKSMAFSPLILSGFLNTPPAKAFFSIGRPLNTTPDPQELEKMMDDLTSLVSFGPKQAGSYILNNVRSYIEENLKELGLLYIKDSFLFPGYKLRSDIVQIEGVQIPHQMFYYCTGKKGMYRTSYIDHTKNDKHYEPNTFTFIDVSRLDKIALEYQTAKSAGVSILGFINESCQDYPFASSVGFAFDGIYEDVPTMSFAPKDIKPIKKLLLSNRATVQIDIDPYLEPSMGKNLYFFSKKNYQKEPLILISAHIDTWFDGATDDCASVAILMQLARRLLKEYPDANLGFLFLDGEEIGLLGAYKALRTLVFEQNATIKALFNLEQAVLDNRTIVSSTISDPSLFLRAVGQDVLSGYLGIPIPAFLRLMWSGGAHLSNIVPFYNAGIPVLTTGPFLVPSFNHTRADTIDKVSVDGIVRSYRFILSTCHSLLTKRAYPNYSNGKNIKETASIHFESIDNNRIIFRVFPAIAGRNISAIILKDGFMPVYKPTVISKHDGSFEIDLLEMELEDDSYLLVRTGGFFPAEGHLKLSS